jgi:phage terminase small subunit
MPALANNRRELFANLLVQGFTEVKAYEKAGYRKHDGNACTLAHHPEVLARIEEIRGELAVEKTGVPIGTSVIAARAKVTPESLIAEHEEVRVGAMESKQFSAANAAIKEKSILSGHRIERSEIGSPGQFDHLSDDELWRVAVERFERLKLLHESDTGH